MSLSQKIAEDLKEAMKAKDALRTSCLRMLKTSLKNKEVEKRDSLKDEEIHSIISSSIRKGQEAMKEFRQGDREDLATKEEEEIKILYGYLPQQLKPEEIEGILQEIISELSSDNLKDLGKVMKVAMARMAGKTQGKEVNELACIIKHADHVLKFSTILHNFSSYASCLLRHPKYIIQILN